VSVNGLVVSGLSGLPLAGASVNLTGTTSEGTPWTEVVVTGANGRFVVSTYAGAYTAVARMAGFASTQSALILNSSSGAVPLTLVLEPSVGGGAASLNGAWLWAGLGIVGAAVVVGAVVYVVRRRDPPRTPPPTELWKDREF
jgi:hypothetical protein